jgi:hypothetical protein
MNRETWMLLRRPLIMMVRAAQQVITIVDGLHGIETREEVRVEYHVNRIEG